MPAIGIQADKKHIDKLFEQFDLDGGGTVNLEELKVGRTALEP